MRYYTAIAALLLGSTLAFWDTLPSAYWLPKVVVALAAAIALFFIEAPIKRTKLDWPVAALVVVFLASWALAEDPLSAVMGPNGQGFYSLAALLPALAVFYLTRYGEAPSVIACSVLLTQGLACALQLGGLWGWEDALVSGRAMGTMGGPPWVGAVVAVCLPSALVMMDRPEWEGESWRRELGAVAWGAGWLALWAAGSRGPLLAAGASTVAFLAATRRIPRPGLLLALAGLLGAVALAWGASRPGSDSGRLELWRIAIRAGLEHPVLGWGPDGFVLALRAHQTAAWTSGVFTLNGSTGLQASAHSDLLQAWTTLGAVGLLALLWLQLAALWTLWRAATDLHPWAEDVPYSGAFASVVAFLVVAKFNPTPPQALYILAAVVSASWATFRPFLARVRDALASALLLFGLTWVALPVGRAVVAEHFHARGRGAYEARAMLPAMNFFRMANEAEPENPHHAAIRIEVIGEVMKDADAALIREASKRALRSAGRIVQARPRDPSSYELMSTAELLTTPVFGQALTRAALQSSKRAVELYPLDIFAGHRWARAAWILRDEREFRAGRSVVEKVESLHARRARR
jgi:O-antigen ligase